MDHESKLTVTNRRDHVPPKAPSSRLYDRRNATRRPCRFHAMVREYSRFIGGIDRSSHFLGLGLQRWKPSRLPCLHQYWILLPNHVLWLLWRVSKHRHDSVHAGFSQSHSVFLVDDLTIQDKRPKTNSNFICQGVLSLTVSATQRNCSGSSLGGRPGSASLPKRFDPLQRNRQANRIPC